MGNPQPTRAWYKKKRYIIPASLLGLLLLYSGNTSQTDSSASTVAPAYTQQQQLQNISPTSQTINLVEKSDKVTDDNLSNNNYYINSAGNTVHSPAYANQVPSGASARCRDGTYSFSQSRRGTCSHHGGVEEWL